ncbi:unnamed protein product [Nesidiocoris tenuis]|uniref:MANSC domain-containing protein n=1 Tax=Nesidiocoris tenuis TaxID=355587 RepID=A0A6H5HAQ4_9HEMI|nr:unnamed protein product [Nesidiocoris tenuis]
MRDSVNKMISSHYFMYKTAMYDYVIYQSSILATAQQLWVEESSSCSGRVLQRSWTPCPSRLSDKIYAGYTPKGNKTAGKFLHVGRDLSLEACVAKCCSDEQTCNVVFMVNNTCYEKLCIFDIAMVIFWNFPGVTSHYTYKWKLLSQPGGEAGNQATSEPLGPSLKLTHLTEGVYTFKVTVTAPGKYGEAEANVTVLSQKRENESPIAIVLPPHQIVKLPNSLAVLDASSSRDDSGITKYHWELQQGPLGYQPNLSDTQTLQLRDLKKAGNYTFRLTLTDTDGATNSTLANVTVLQVPDYPPEANAGSSIVLFLPRNNVTLNGSLSSDDKGIVSWEWTKSPSDQDKAVDMQPASGVWCASVPECATRIRKTRAKLVTHSSKAQNKSKCLSQRQSNRTAKPTRTFSSRTAMGKATGPNLSETASRRSLESRPEIWSPSPRSLFDQASPGLVTNDAKRTHPITLLGVGPGLSRTGLSEQTLIARLPTMNTLPGHH